MMHPSFVRLTLPFLVLAVLSPTLARADRLFADVPPDHRYFVAISELERRGILNGFADGTFRPEADISRAAALKVVLLTAGAEVSGVVTSRPFPDVPIDEWFAGITWKGVELGIVKGDGEGFFRPSRNVSRSEALAMLFRAEGTEPDAVESDPFADVPSYAWYAGYFAAAKNRGLFSGSNAGPDHLLTRGELADLAYRFFENDWSESELIGVASYYGRGFDGANTASGETLSNDDFVAAHRTLPFGSRVRVTHADSLKSVVVKIIDRGPYVDGRVIDLSQAAFEALAPLSSGVARVRLEVVPETTALGLPSVCAPEQPETVAPDTFEGLELFTPIPTRLAVGEVFEVKGKVTAEPLPEEVTLSYTFAGKTSYFSGRLEGATFTIPFLLDQPGAYELTMLPGRSGRSRVADVTAIVSECEPEGASESPAPKNFRHTLQNGETVLLWDDVENDIFRIEIKQDDKSFTYFVRDKNEFSPPLFPLKSFEEGLITLHIWGAKSTGGALQRTGHWISGGEKRLYAVEHLSRDDNEITDVELTSDFVLGENIVLRGSTDKALDPAVVIIQPDESIIEIPLTVNGSEFWATFSPTQNGRHVFEINQDDALMLFVGASIPRGMVPLIPSYFDLRNQDAQVPVAREQMPEVMLALLNQERTKRNLATLTLDTDLARLAQFRADDMCANDYLAHTDTEGNTAEDYRALYNIQTAVAENLAKDNNTRGAHAGLMRSPLHRKAIIDPTHVRVGLGFCFAGEPDTSPLVVVQIFGGEAFRADNIPAYRENILAEVNSIRIEDPVLPNATLESIAQNWAETMAKNDFWGFEYGDLSLEKTIRAAGVTTSAKSIVFKLGSISEIENTFLQNEITIGDSTQENFLLDPRFQKMGVGITQNDTWDVFLVVLGTE